MTNTKQPSQQQQTALPPVASLSKRDYARHQSVSPRTLDHWREDGLPCLVVSTRKVLFPIADCDQWVRDRFLVASGVTGTHAAPGIHGGRQG